MFKVLHSRVFKAFSTVIYMGKVLHGHIGKRVGLRAAKIMAHTQFSTKLYNVSD